MIERKETPSKNDYKKIIENVDSINKKMDDLTKDIKDLKLNQKEATYWNLMAYAITVIALALTAYYGIPTKPNYVIILLYVLLLVGFSILTYASLSFLCHVILSRKSK